MEHEQQRRRERERGTSVRRTERLVAQMAPWHHRRPAPRPAASLGGARLASGMPALRAAFTDLLASLTASFSAANAANCLRGGFSLGFDPPPAAAASPGRAFVLDSGSLPPLLAVDASACSALMCACSRGAGSMLAQCGHGSSRSMMWLAVCGSDVDQRSDGDCLQELRFLAWRAMACVQAGWGGGVGRGGEATAARGRRYEGTTSRCKHKCKVTKWPRDTDAENSARGVRKSRDSPKLYVWSAQIDSNVIVNY